MEEENKVTAEEVVEGNAELYREEPAWLKEE